MRAAPVPQAPARARIRVSHETRYGYASPVSLSRQLLHLTPRTLAHQAVVAHRIAITPSPAESGSRIDYFDNQTVHAVVTTPHRELSILAESTVDLAPRRTSSALANPEFRSWQAVRDTLATPRDAAGFAAARFSFESPHVALSPALLAYAGPSFAHGQALLESILDLNRRIHADFAFDPAATSVATPLADVLDERRGVCQDFAHLMTGCLRTMGLAARYVSGYIVTHPPPGQARLIGSDASHAWVSVWCPGADPTCGDWIDLDPTNDCLPDQEHVTLAWGRDFSDVTPTRGVFLGSGDEDLSVRVTVGRLADPAA